MTKTTTKTNLSVNLNKIALLRNSRGRDYPNVLDFARRFVALGVDGITIHPRQDERHIKRRDAADLAAYLRPTEVELNIEGYPSADFLHLIEQTRPHQCTLVPDSETQLTSDHGWDVVPSTALLESALQRLRAAGVRSALFLDPQVDQVTAAAGVGCDRVELYTESYAVAYRQGGDAALLRRYQQAAQAAVSVGLGVNAGHDLDLHNLAAFLSAVGPVLEVSIGHALLVECIEQGLNATVSAYRQICAGGT